MVKQTIQYRKPRVVEPVPDQNGLQFQEPSREAKIQEKNIFVDNYNVKKKEKLQKQKQPKLKKIRVRNKVKKEPVLNIELEKPVDTDLNSVENIMEEVSNM